MSGHRRSHTVSRFYLRAFSEGGHIAVVRDRRLNLVGVKRATVERDAYALREPDGTLYQGIENGQFAETERLAAPVHRLLREGTMPDPLGWMHYLLYLGLSIARSRRGMAMSDAALPDELATMAPPGSDERRRLFLRSLVTRIWGRCTWVLGQLDPLLISLPQDSRLITADQPVGLWSDRHPVVSQLGLIRAPLLVHPVDRRHVLWFKKPYESWPAWISDPLLVAANANYAMSEVATTEILVHPEDAAAFLLWLPPERAGSRLGTGLPVARSLPLWLPNRRQPATVPDESIESVLKRSRRSKDLAFVARHAGLNADSVLAASLTPGGGPCAALLKTERGFQTFTAEVTFERAA